MCVLGLEMLGHFASFCVFLCLCRHLILEEVLATSEEVLARPGEVLAWLAGWNAGLSDWLAGWLAGWLGWRVLARLEGVLLMLEGVLTRLEEVPAVLGRCLPC